MPKFELTYGTNTYVLAKEPADWVNCKLNFIRSETFNSVLRSVATPIKFVFADRDYLLNIYNLDGFEAVVGFKAYLEDDITLEYVLFYEGTLDFSTIEIDKDYLSIEIIENNDIARFVANQEMEVDLESETNLIGETVTDQTITDCDLLISGANLKNWVEFLSNTGTLNFSVASGPGVTTPQRYLNPIPYSVLTASIPVDNSILMVNDTDDDKMLHYDIDIHTVINIAINRRKATSTSSILVRVGLFVVDILGAIVRVDSLFTEAKNIIKIHPITAPPTPIVNLSYNMNLTKRGEILVEQGNQAYLGVEIYVQIGNYINQNQVVMAYGNMSLETNRANLVWYSVTSFDAITVKGFLAKDCVQRVLKRIVKDDLIFSLPVLSNFAYNPYVGGDLFPVFFTNGNRLRGIDSKIKMSFKNLFETLNKLVPIGIFYDGKNRFYIDNIDKFYQNVQIFTLENVTDFKINVNEKDIFNQIEVGCGENEENYQLNSKAEVNVTSQYSVQMAKIKNDLNLVTEYKYDSFGILRKILEATTENVTTNKTDDYTNYLINIGFQLIQIGVNKYNTNFPQVFFGAPIDDLFNYYFSPQRTILRNGHKFGFLNSIQNKTIKFNSSPCELNYQIDMGDGLGFISEHTDLNISDVENYFLYLPELYSFNCPINANILNQLSTNPHGYVKFTHDSETYYGYIESVEVNLNDFNAKWKLKKRYPR